MIMMVWKTFQIPIAEKGEFSKLELMHQTVSLKRQQKERSRLLSLPLRAEHSPVYREPGSEISLTTMKLSYLKLSLQRQTNTSPTSHKNQQKDLRMRLLIRVFLQRCPQTCLSHTFSGRMITHGISSLDLKTSRRLVNACTAISHLPKIPKLLNDTIWSQRDKNVPERELKFSTHIWMKQLLSQHIEKLQLSTNVAQLPKQTKLSLLK